MRAVFVIFFVSFGSVLFAETPHDVRAVVIKHEKARKQLDASAITKLDNIKRAYMRKGDMERAQAAEDAIVLIKDGKIVTLDNSRRFFREVVGKKWEWKHYASQWFILNKDGTAIFSGHEGMTWKLYEERTIGFNFTAFGKGTAILKWAPDLKSYEGIDLDFKTKITGTEISE